MAAQIRQTHALQFVEAQFLKLDALLTRIRVLIVQVRNVRKDLDVVAPGWRLRRVTAGGRNKIDCRIIGKFLVVKYAVKVRVLIA